MHIEQNKMEEIVLGDEHEWAKKSRYKSRGTCKDSFEKKSKNLVYLFNV